MSNHPTRLRELDRVTPPDLRAEVDTRLRRQPNETYGDPPPFPHGPRRFATGVAVGLALAVFVGALAWWGFSTGAPSPVSSPPDGVPAPSAPGVKAPTPSPTSTCQTRPIFSVPTQCFDPEANPFNEERSSEVTFAEAQAAADFPIYAPQTALAEDGTLTHVWISVPAEPRGTPPYHLTEVALSYGSGIQITFQPWQYGPKAAPFSEEQVAEAFRQMANEMPAGTATVATIDGIPALEVHGNLEVTDNPWSLEMHLGSKNANAVEMTIRGRRSPAELETVAESIVAQWKAAGSGAG